MKKAFIAGMIALGLVSCTDDDVVTGTSNSSQINFDVTASNGNSRAADVYCNNNKPASFTVYGAYTADGATSAVDFMNDEITQNGTAWTNATTRYWPNTGSLDFYAYKNGTFDTDTKSFTDFTVDDNVANQVDLIYAVNKGQKKAGTGTQEDVKLNFRHALSQVVFNAVNKSKTLHVTVNGVGIHNLQNKGTYSVADIADNTLDVIEDHTGAGTDVSNRGTWSNLANTGTLASYAVSGLNVTLTDNNADDVKNLTDGADVADGESTPRGYANAMLLIPQQHKGLLIAGGNDSGDADVEENGTYFTVNCTIYNIAGDTFAGEDKEGILYSGDIRIPVSIDWNQGYKYIYTFVFGDGNGGWDPDEPKPVLYPITFQVSVDDFIDYVPAGDLDINMKTE